MHIQPRQRRRLTLPLVLERLEFVHRRQQLALEVRLVSYYPLEIYIVQDHFGVAPRLNPLLSWWIGVLPDQTPSALFCTPGRFCCVHLMHYLVGLKGRNAAESPEEKGDAFSQVGFEFIFRGIARHDPIVVTLPIFGFLIPYNGRC
jgi:hypothetical protein